MLTEKGFTIYNSSDFSLKLNVSFGVNTENIHLTCILQVLLNIGAEHSLHFLN